MAALHPELKGKQAAFTWAAGELPQLPPESPVLPNPLQSIFEAAYAPPAPTAATVPMTMGTVAALLPPPKLACWSSLC